MQEITRHFVREAMDNRLKQTMETAVARIGEHTAKLRSWRSPRRGRQAALPRNVVSEAESHVVDNGSGDDGLNDLLIVSQYQRMSHYGLAGFGTAAAYAKALGRSDDEKTLKKIVADVYRGDEIASRLADLGNGSCLSATRGRRRNRGVGRRGRSPPRPTLRWHRSAQPGTEPCVENLPP